MFPHSCRDLFSHLISRDRLAANLNICHILDIANPLFCHLCHIRHFCQILPCSPKSPISQKSPLAKGALLPSKLNRQTSSKNLPFSRKSPKLPLSKGTHLASNRPFAWWRHFTTRTRILQRFAFLCKLRLLLFKPRWDHQIWIWKEKRKGCGRSSKIAPSCKWPIWITSPWRSFITCISGHKLLFPLYTLEKDYGILYWIDRNVTNVVL